MDPSRFDTFAKSLTMTASRRRAVAGLFAGLLAPLLAKDELSAKKGKGKGKKKRKALPPRHRHRHLAAVAASRTAPAKRPARTMIAEPPARRALALARPAAGAARQGSAAVAPASPRVNRKGASVVTMVAVARVAIAAGLGLVGCATSTGTAPAS